jgi:hypothetical protein
VVGGGKRTLDVFFFAKKARNERWEVVTGPCIQDNFSDGTADIVIILLIRNRYR